MSSYPRHSPDCIGPKIVGSSGSENSRTAWGAQDRCVIGSEVSRVEVQVTMLLAQTIEKVRGRESLVGARVLEVLAQSSTGKVGTMRGSALAACNGAHHQTVWAKPTLHLKGRCWDWAAWYCCYGVRGTRHADGSSVRRPSSGGQPQA
jgi:hypothetical protein